jgi:hypothetical protein
MTVMTLALALSVSLLVAQSAAPPPLQREQLTLPAAPGSEKFAVIGDNGTGKRPQYEVGALMAQAHALFPFELVLMCGNNICGRKNQESYRRKFELPYQELLARGVPVVFAGHDHFYERILPQKGITHFVTGAAGQLRRNGVARTGLTAKAFDLDRHFMLVEMAGDTLHFQARSRAGRTIDSGSLPSGVRPRTCSNR